MLYCYISYSCHLRSSLHGGCHDLINSYGIFTSEMTTEYLLQRWPRCIYFRDDHGIFTSEMTTEYLLQRWPRNILFRDDHGRFTSEMSMEYLLQRRICSVCCSHNLILPSRGRRGRMVVEFATIYAISAYHH